MKSIKYHIIGIAKTFELLFKGNYLLFFIPGAIITLLFLWLRSGILGADQAVDLASDNSWYGWAANLFDSGVHKMFGLLDSIFEQLYIFIVLTALSPFNTLLGEKLDTRLTNTTFKGGLIRFVNDIIRMIFVVILALVLEFGFMGIYWLFSKAFGLDFIDDYVYWLLSAFFFGFSFYDFALERYETGVFGTLGFAFRNPLSMILTGGIFLAIYAIPIAGVPLSPVLTLMISTVVYLYITGKLPISKELKTSEDE